MTQTPNLGPRRFTAGDPVGNDVNIDGNQAEIFNGLGGDASILIIGPTGQAWSQLNDQAGPVIRGISDTPLGVAALSFDFANANQGIWEFFHSGGSEQNFFGSTGTSNPSFFGWVGAPSELLDEVVFSADGGMTLDNINAHVVPEPGAGLLLAGGLLMLAAGRGRS